MKGNSVLLTPDPKGHFMEGVVSGTPSPGTVMQIKEATAMQGGRFTWEVYDRAADSNRPQGPLAILLEDHLQGKTYSDAYTDGDRCFLYVPLPGDEMNLRVSAPGTGTGDSVAIGDLFIVNDGDGLLVDTTGSPEIEPFMACEALSDVVAAGTMTHVMYTGY
jgi:hypothetical protein